MPDPIVTAGIERAEKGLNLRPALICALILFSLMALGFRGYKLSSEGLSEDELNKLKAVADYRDRGISSSNGEHPMLMKGLITLSMVLSESWNSTDLVKSSPHLSIATESALRVPSIVVGSLSTILIFLITSELFGTLTGLIAAALWAVDPTAIGFNRIAKEDSFYLFFFLLGNFLWIRGQTMAERGSAFTAYYCGAAVGFGGMMASKYLPHLLAVSASYYNVFQRLPFRQWRMGKIRWLAFLGIMGLAFLLFNPTILLPSTWQEMRIFASEKRIGHDAYEFAGTLYPNQMSLWLQGMPWYFYFLFMAVKTPLITLLAFVPGLILLFRRSLGDGRFFILFWLMFWFFPFSLLGGKFTRYYTLVLPAVIVVSAIGINYIAKLLTNSVSTQGIRSLRLSYSGLAVILLAVIGSIQASILSMPHYKLYTNSVAGGERARGSYFPHDEFYDASMRDAIKFIAERSRRGTTVASESPELVRYYSRVSGRDDLETISLSDPDELARLQNGDVLIVSRGRRYFSNDLLQKQLEQSSTPVTTLYLHGIPSVYIYVLDQITLSSLQRILHDARAAQRLPVSAGRSG
jgi:predicted membrane-bound dolichyl-phosphate-mannose-protein mannosyltransferase